MSVVIHHGPAPPAPEEHLDPVQAELARLTRKSPTAHYKPDEHPGTVKAHVTVEPDDQVVAQGGGLITKEVCEPKPAQCTSDDPDPAVHTFSVHPMVLGKMDWYRNGVDRPWKLPLQVSGFDLKTHHAVFSLELKVEVDMTGLTLEETNTRVQALFKQAILDCAEPKDTAHDEATAGS